VARVEELRDKLFQLVGHWYARDRMFTLDWYYMNGYGLDNTSFDELATDDIHDDTYPTLGTSAQDFIRGYLEAEETVLLVLGPPGTGKTRLVRNILGTMSLRKGDSARVMYTADKRTLEHDEIFVNFVTRSHDAFVVEDADHMLMARSSGNHDLHRFLAIADGVVRAQGRKIIFTSNLPNITDVDEALLRPGRCYASVRTRLMNREEASVLLHRLVDDVARREALLTSLFPEGVRGVSVADVYRACKSRQLS
jgi:SpoVK/Ycf46/Vps4 family AAA+-type ATPase